MYDTLKKWMEKDRHEITAVAEEFTKLAKNYGPVF
jgi:hypothetical protein